jgi:oligopeptide transport system permease protein
MQANSASLRRFKRNKLALFGGVIIVLLILLSLIGHKLAPDTSPNTNHQELYLRFKKPGYAAYYLVVHSEDGKKTLGANSLSILLDSFYWNENGLNYKKSNSSDWQLSPLGSDTKIRKTVFYLGADGLGRDVFSRLIVGIKISMQVGLIAVIISLLIGVIAGSLAGYYGGWRDKLVLWWMNVFWAIPTVLLAMVLLVSYKGTNEHQIYIVFLAVGLTMWVDTARLIRGLFLQLRERQFVEATRALGFSDSRIIFRHILPNTLPSLIVMTAANFASAILMESGLSYLGLGVQPPAPSWGSMLREYYSYLGTEVSFLAIFPGVAITLAVFSFYALGNGLRDAWDVKGL